MLSYEKVIRVGSRKSELALIQTRSVIGRLQKIYPQQKFEIHTMTTIGDRVLNISLPKIGEKSLFTRDLEDALRSGGVDFVVHSLKDLPTVLPDGMVIGAVLEREDERDALVLKKEFANYTIETLPHGSVIGTSSLRRTAQIRRLYPHLIVCDIRGNLNTRLAKLDAPDSRFAGIILAQAGLERMKWTNRVSQVLEPKNVLYAVGQGALAVECRGNDYNTLRMLQNLICVPTTCRVLAERSFLKTLGGGCSAPVAVWSQLNGDFATGREECQSKMRITGAVWSLDGTTELREEKTCVFEKDTSKRPLLNDDDLNNSNDEGVQPLKRSKNEDDFTDQSNLSIINEDEDLDSLSKNYEVKTLIKKHIELAKMCPFLAEEKDENNLNNNLRRGGGDADVLDSRCPLHLGVGLDVMGECPFVGTNEKVSHEEVHQCLFSKKTEEMPSTSKFSKIKNDNENENGNRDNDKDKVPVSKCPFIQKSVQIFDYKEEEKQLPRTIPLTDIKNLFCGIYKHDFLSNDLFKKCNDFGKMIADQLIEHGALDIMKKAQAEIHSKT